jgi:ADP-heptose:LPS heptosyltransferase
MKKLLLIRLSSLGDIIFNIPLANVLKRSGYEVHWLVGEKGRDVLEGNPCVDKVIYAGKYLETLRQLRAEKYDIAIDTQGLLKSAVFTALCGAKRRITGTDAREGAGLAGSERVEIPKNMKFKEHVSRKYLKYAQYLGLDIENAAVTLPETPTTPSLPEGKPVAVLCPATTWANKHWNKDHWKTLAAALSDKYNLVFTGTACDNDLINYIGSGTNLAGKTNLKELAEVFRRADLVVSLDSGSTHLAWAAGAKKIIAIFCATPKVLYTPPGHIGLSGGLPCQPCHKKKCRWGNMPCTRYPQPQEVIELC